MKAKTLLVAAAALAAATISSQAQVYSQNIVGYVNVVAPVGGQYALWANPLDNGTNNITSLLPSTTPNGSQVLTWNGVNYQIANKTFGNWSTNLSIPPGTGFFVKFPVAAGAVTNTFVGNVLVQNSNGVGGGTNSVNLPNLSYVLAGSSIPFGGNLTDVGDGTLNLGVALKNGSQILVWNGTAYQIANKTFGNWSTNLNLSVGQGYFIKSNGATNWVQVLP